MNKQKRRIFIIEKAPRVLNALRTLLADIECEGGVAQSVCEMLGRAYSANLDKLVIDLRDTEAGPGSVSGEIKDLKLNLVGGVIVLTGEANLPVVSPRINELARQPFSSEGVTSRLRAFVHALFWQKAGKKARLSL